MLSGKEGAPQVIEVIHDQAKEPTSHLDALANRLAQLSLGKLQKTNALVEVRERTLFDDSPEAALTGLWRTWLERTREGQVWLSDARPYLLALKQKGLFWPADHPLGVVEGSRFTSRKFFGWEKEIQHHVRTRLHARPDPSRTENDLVTSQPSASVDLGGLSPSQQQALWVLAASPVSLLTGGPGTGKTTIMAALYARLRAQGTGQVLFAAPTGKAADRLTASLARAGSDRPPQAFTIHRLLHYSARQRTFLKNQANPINAEWVIIDEASMLDLELLVRVFRAMSPRTRLILVGDPNQLPPVEPGAPFFDLVESADKLGLPHAHLSQSHRQTLKDATGGTASLVRVIQAIQDRSDVGSLLGTLGDTAFHSTKTSFGFVPHAQLNAHIHEHCAPAVIDAVPLVLNRDGAEFSNDDLTIKSVSSQLKLVESHQILAVTRESGPYAAARVNSRVAAWRRHGLQHPPAWLPGEPVLVEQNDYGRSLWNGDLGIIWPVNLASRSNEDLAVVFRRGDSLRVFLLSSIAHLLTRADAITVHKSQGSEYDRVTLVLSDDALLLNRPLLYTAITRAKAGVTVVGEVEMFVKVLGD